MIMDKKLSDYTDADIAAMTEVERDIAILHLEQRVARDRQSLPSKERGKEKGKRKPAQAEKPQVQKKSLVEEIAMQVCGKGKVVWTHKEEKELAYYREQQRRLALKKEKKKAVAA